MIFLAFRASFATVSGSQTTPSQFNTKMCKASFSSIGLFFELDM